MALPEIKYAGISYKNAEPFKPTIYHGPVEALTAHDLGNLLFGIARVRWNPNTSSMEPFRYDDDQRASDVSKVYGNPLWPNWKP